MVARGRGRALAGRKLRGGATGGREDGVALGAVNDGAVVHGVYHGACGKCDVITEDSAIRCEMCSDFLPSTVVLPSPWALTVSVDWPSASKEKKKHD